MKIKLSNEEIRESLEIEAPAFLKYVTQIINLANQNAQGTRPRVVGQLSDLIQEFSGKTIDEWEQWYLQRYPDAIRNAKEKISAMVVNLKDAIQNIDENMINEWVKDLVIVQTFIGLKFQEAILKKGAEVKGVDCRLSDNIDESKGIDGYIGDIPVSIKSDTYKIKKALREDIEETRKIFSDLEDFIKYKEWDAIVRTDAQSQGENTIKDWKTRSPRGETSKSQGLNTSTQKYNRGKQLNARGQKPEVKNQKPRITGVKSNELTYKVQPPGGEIATAIQVPSYSIPVKKPPFNRDAFSPFLDCSLSTLRESQLLIDYMYLTIQGGFDELLCLNVITDVEKYWYQIETVKKVLKHFHGRVLLCDEVGLGKTIEAGMLIKEYLLRGMIRDILILTPTSLVSQWREEIWFAEFSSQPENFSETWVVSWLRRGGEKRPFFR